MCKTVIFKRVICKTGSVICNAVSVMCTNVNVICETGSIRCKTVNVVCKNVSVICKSNILNYTKYSPSIEISCSMNDTKCNGTYYC